MGESVRGFLESCSQSARRAALTQAGRERAMSDEQLRDLISRSRHTRLNAQRVLAEHDRLISRSREVLSRASEALAKAQAIVGSASEPKLDERPIR